MFAKPRPKKSLLPPPSKKRKATHTVEEITFDNSARAEYLTGFHKRKLQRQKHAQEEAAKRARQERIELRKQIKEDRKQQVEDHVKNVEAILREAQVAGLGSDQELEAGSDNEAEGEWGGLEDSPPTPVLETVDHEEEFIDEDLYTKVKVEAVSIDRDGLHSKAELEAENEEGNEEDGNGTKKAVSGATGEAKARKDLPKKKKKKFRYQSKVERQLTDRKNKAKSRR